MNYHAHIYWNSAEQRIWALHLRSLLRKLGCTIGRPWDTPIGPHPLAMFQAVYNSETQSIVENTLMTQRNGLSILLHEDTGNDVRDHTEGARWLGNKLKLDIEWLREYARGHHA